MVSGRVADNFLEFVGARTRRSVWLECCASARSETVLRTTKLTSSFVIARSWVVIQRFQHSPLLTSKRVTSRLCLNVLRDRLVGSWARCIFNIGSRSLTSSVFRSILSHVRNLYGVSSWTRSGWHVMLFLWSSFRANPPAGGLCTDEHCCLVSICTCSGCILEDLNFSITTRLAHREIRSALLSRVDIRIISSRTWNTNANLRS